MMGLYAKLPYAVAPGMGINAFFTYNLILAQHIPWQTALGMVFWSGVIFLILSITPIRSSIVKSMPLIIRQSAAVGIGLFLTFIGLKNGGIVISHPVTFVTIAPLSIDTLYLALSMLLILILLKRKSALAFIAGILLVTFFFFITKRLSIPESFLSHPDFQSVFFQIDFAGALKWSFLPAILSILFTDLFDSISTFMGLAQSGGFLDKDGNPIRLKEGLIVDSFATGLAGLFGTSSGTAYIESAAGIEAGGKTGLTAVFTALLFLPCFFIAPLVGMIPELATAPVLIIVGFLMFRSVKEMDLSKIEEALPAFLTVILIPLTFSITQGLIWGILSYVALHLLTGNRKKLPLGLYLTAVICFSLLFL